MKLKCAMVTLAMLAAATGCSGQAALPPRVGSPAPVTASAPAERQTELFYNPFSRVPVRFKVAGLTTDAYPKLEANILKGLPQLYAQAKEAYNVALFPDGISELAVISVKTHYQLPHKDSLEEKIATANRAIDNVVSYLSDSVLTWPQVKFVVPSSSSDIEAAAEPKRINDLVDMISIYPVQNFAEIARVSGNLKYGQRYIPFGMDVETDTALGGIAKRITFTPTDKGVETSFEYGSIVWKLGAFPQNVLETPALEVLHAALAQITMRHDKENLGGIRDRERAKEIVNRNLLLEEYVVHGVGQAWFEQLNNKWQLGYDVASFRNNPNVSLWWRDENVIKVAGLVRDKKPAYVIDLYRNSPEKLVAEAGIVIK